MIEALDAVSALFRGILFLVCATICLHFLFWAVIAARDAYQYNAARDRARPAVAAECIAHPPPKNNDPLGDVDRFLCQR